MSEKIDSENSDCNKLNLLENIKEIHTEDYASETEEIETEEQQNEAPQSSPQTHQTSPFKSPNPKHHQQIRLLEDFFNNATQTLPHPVPCLREEGEEIDVVISGGGAKGYYVVGAYAILHHLIKANSVKVMRWAGASVGAASAIFMYCDVSPVDWASTYWITRKNINKKNISIADGFRERAHALLPDDAHLLCNGKVFISATRLSYTGPTNVILSQFESKEDLIEACVASLSIPFVTSKELSHKFRGERFWDGGVTNNSPLFKDSHLLNRRQLYFHVSKVAYPANMSFRFNDICIESLIARGTLLMRQFVLCQLSKKNHEIQWYTSKEQLTNVSNERLTFGTMIRNSIAKIRSAPSLLKFQQNLNQNSSLEEQNGDLDNLSNNNQVALSNDFSISVRSNGLKDYLDVKKKRILRFALLLLTLCVFFFMSKRAFGKSKMRIPIPNGPNFLFSILPLRPISLR